MKIDRLIGMLSILLQQEKVTAQYLAEKFEVSRRTIYRDIEDLCKAGIPIRTETGMMGGISIMDGYKIDKTLLTSAEMQAVLNGLKSLDSAAGSNRYQLLIEKLAVKETRIAVNDHVLIDLSTWNTSFLAPRIEQIRSAVEQKHLVSFRYFAPNRESERIIEPYLLVFRWFSWYVWGYCRMRGAFRLFKLSRMMDLSISGEVFEPRPVPELDEIPSEVYNPDSLSVTAVFDSEVRWRLVEEFDVSKLTLLPDGRYLAHFSWSDKESLFSYLFGFRDHVELLEPVELREEFAGMAEKIFMKYRE